MPIPKRVASFNKKVFNRAARPVAARLPGFGVIQHYGRRSGRQYSTPVTVFVDGDRYVIALTYGADTDWLRNVLAAGGCTIEYRRSMWQVTDPQLLPAESGMTAVPRLIRAILRVLNVTEFLSLRQETTPS